MANIPHQCWEGLGCGQPREHYGSALLQNLLWLLSFFPREASTHGGWCRQEASLHANLLGDLRQIAQEVPSRTLCESKVLLTTTRADPLAKFLAVPGQATSPV